jgi:hypothetical protein
MPLDDQEKPNAGHIIDAYLEAIVALLAIRTPVVQAAISSALPPEMVVASSYAGESLIIPVSGMLKSMQREGFDDVKSLHRSVRQANWVFLGAMWDVLKRHPRFKTFEKEPEIEFFRHVRNGASHGGRLNFRSLRAPAKWRDKEIAESMRGTPVFPDLLRDGDPILLVQDIERTYGEISEG